jgi:hypothetical protein
MPGALFGCQAQMQDLIIILLSLNSLRDGGAGKGATGRLLIAKAVVHFLLSARKIGFFLLRYRYYDTRSMNGTTTPKDANRM